MISMKSSITRMSALSIFIGSWFFGSWASCCFGQAAKLRDARMVSPSAIATKADVDYCFARVRGLEPERLPPAYLVLRLTVAVSYRNSGTRPMILPLGQARRRGVDIEAVIAKKTDQRHSEAQRGLDGEAGRSADGCQDGDAGHHRLLHQFEAGSAADHQQVIGERQAIVEIGSANQLIDGVVAAHVFTRQQ